MVDVGGDLGTVPQVTNLCPPSTPEPEPALKLATADAAAEPSGSEDVTGGGSRTAAPPTPRPVRLRRPFKAALLLSVLLAAMTAARTASTASTYASIAPGPTGNLTSSVEGDVRDPHVGDAGAFLYTTVNVVPLSWTDWLASKLPWSETEVVSTTGPTGEDDRVAAIEQMKSSKRAAAIVAITEVDGPSGLDHYDAAVVVVSVQPGSPASAAGIRPQDRVLSYDGINVASITALADAVKSHGPGQLAVAVERAGHRMTVDVDMGDALVLGVEGVTEISGNFQLDADTSGVGGSSAGLMMTLAFIDALSPGDLTGDQVVAGTGVIDTNGAVSAIRGARHKARAAEDAGATVFFTPDANMRQAGAGASDALEVVAVSSYRDALAWLCAHGATDDVCAAH